MRRLKHIIFVLFLLNYNSYSQKVEFTSSNLPILVIKTYYSSPIPDEPKIQAHLGIIDNGEGKRNNINDAFNGYDGRIGIEIRGASSQMFPKKNYGFETQLPDGENNNVSLLGLPKENDWVLHGPYTDKSLMRNALAYYIGNQLNEYCPRTRWCELMINDEYMGLYLFTEKIKRDKNRVNIEKMDLNDIEGDDLTGGYIFSLDRNEGNDTGWNSPYTNQVFYNYRYPKYYEITQEQKSYIETYFTDFESKMNNANYLDYYEEFIDIDSWVDYSLATEIGKHIDGYKLSFYMYKERDSKGGKIHFGPLWDFNLAYGNYNFAQDPGPEEWSYLWASLGYLRPFWIIKLNNIPKIRNRTKCRWEELRNNKFNTDTILTFIDNTLELIDEAKNRNFNKWDVIGKYVWPNYYVGATYEDEIIYLKNWLIDRLNWMDKNMIGNCVPTSNENLDKDFSIEIYPNPIIDKAYIRVNSNSYTNGKLVIYNIYAQKIKELDISGSEIFEINLDNVHKEVLFYQVISNGKILNRGKLINLK